MGRKKNKAKWTKKATFCVNIKSQDMDMFPVNYTRADLASNIAPGMWN